MLGRWPLRRWFRVLWCLLTLGVIGCLPLIIIDFQRTGYSVHDQASFISALFVLMTVPITFYEVAMHLEYFSRPALQIHVIRILWMVPIYAIDAWAALRFPQISIYANTLRECYEAYVIYNFFMYLLRYLHEEYGDIHAYFSTKEDVPHMWGLQYCMQPWRMGEDFFWECKKGVLAYVILRPATSVVGFIAALFGKYGDAMLRFDRAYVYIVLVNNVSQGWALYCLILMFLATREELAPIRPLPKFIVVKIIVFASFWQSVAIAILVSTGVIRPSEFTFMDRKDIAAGLQNFLICLEMFPAAVSHAYAFPPKDYLDPQQQRRRGLVQSLRAMFDVRDVFEDMNLVVDDTVTRTTDGLAGAGRGVWATAQRTRDRAINTPGALMALFGKGRAPYRERSTHSSHVDWGSQPSRDEAGLNHQLLPHSREERHEERRQRASSASPKS